ncbi:unnamed protein product, partial [Closterium sp. Naga37s-1]
EREERLKAAPANADGAVESREVNGQAAVKRLQTSFVESGVSAALLRYLRDAGPLLLRDSWDLPGGHDDAEEARQQLKAANSDAQAIADERCHALRHACELLGQEEESMEELHLDDQLSALSIELAALERAEAALQHAEEAAGQVTCGAQGEGSEAAQVAALTRVKADLAASLQRCAAAEGLSSHLNAAAATAAAAAAAAATQSREEQRQPAEGSTRSAGPWPTSGSSSTLEAASQGREAHAAVQQLAALLCPAALTAQTARSLSLRLPLPSPHSLPSSPLDREAAASGSAAALTCASASATGKAGLPGVVWGSAGEGSIGEEGSATVEVALLPGGRVAAASIEAPGLPHRSLPLHPSTNAAHSATGADQQHSGRAGVPVAAAVAEAACLLRLLALRRAHMAHALATAPFPPRYMVKMAGEGAFKVKWANGATLTLTACNDWPMPGGHLAVADVELPHTAQSGEEKQQLLSLLSTAVLRHHAVWVLVALPSPLPTAWQGDAQQQDSSPPVPPAPSALGGVIAAAGACLRKAMMVALKTT